MLDVLTIDLVREAQKRIAPYVLRTPVLEHRLDHDATLLCKPELLQSIGAFKIRGAFNMMATLPRDCPGVVAHSSGNHAQAVARAARVLGLRAVIVMPKDAPALKRKRTEADGAEVVEVSNDSSERARVADELAKTRNYVLVPPYDHPLIAAGQGTLAVELCEDKKDIDRFYCPLSGGGLLAGCAVAVAALSPKTEIVGVEPEDGDDWKKSLAAGERVTVAPPKTIADGLCVRTPGEKTWPVIRRHVARIETVRDDELLDAMRFALTELRVVLEPSGAASLAVALRERRGRSAVVLSGGNVDPVVLSRALARGDRTISA
jgi:threo-3-hydroxy-L-aspartate ammonia-lyase